jgi:glutaredoxin
MTMRNKIIIPTFLFGVVLIFSFFILFQAKNKNQDDKQIILFYGQGCPHCALVEKYIEENKIQDKISFTQKEVYYHQNNARELEKKAKACGLKSDAIGVHLFWDGEKCYLGDREIIEFFKKKIGGN